MKVRMIFGTYLPQSDDRPDKELPVDTIQDLDDATAKALVDAGRAEPTEPVVPKGK